MPEHSKEPLRPGSVILLLAGAVVGAAFFVLGFMRGLDHALDTGAANFFAYGLITPGLALMIVGLRRRRAK